MQGPIWRPDAANRHNDCARLIVNTQLLSVTHDRQASPNAEQVEEEWPVAAASAACRALRPAEGVAHEGHPGVGVLLDGVGGCGGNAAQATLAHTNLQLEVTLLTPGT